MKVNKNLLGRAFRNVPSSEKAIKKLLDTGFEEIPSKGKFRALIKTKNDDK